MKQELGTPSTSDKQAKPVKAKPEKDLYKPYKMPPFLWTAIRVLGQIFFAIVARVRLSGLENIPAEGPFIIASNHLSWFDVPLIPAYFSRPVIYMAKEETFLGRLGWLVRFMGAAFWCTGPARCCHRQRKAPQKVQASCHHHLRSAHDPQAKGPESDARGCRRHHRTGHAQNR